MPISFPIPIATDRDTTRVFYAELEFDQDNDRFSGIAEIGEHVDLKPGWISFHGRDPDELRAAFGEALQAHQEVASPPDRCESSS